MTDIAIGIVMQRPVGMLQRRHFRVGQGKGRAVEGSEGKTGTKEQKCYELFHDEYLKIYVVSVWDEKQGLPSGRGGNSRYRAAVRQDAAWLRCPLLWSHGRHRKESPKPDMTASLQL